MLTLGIVEGTITVAIGILVLTNLSSNTAALHRAFGPLAIVLVGVIAWRVFDQGQGTSPAAIAGLAAGAVLAFGLPVAAFAVAWRLGRTPERPVATVHEHPARRRARTEREAA